ncbi:PREDICTED: calnexin-like [Amphimedon queenslandica]|uniref:Calnexin n=1 Tax=Amphimedon queenslandica TaxID=400682 RepID=A0AAN0IFB4_AMPQE|nr:PREDICTED: calnexin-like [Amphimedon queenslandica]|eukprot:XP_003387493.1 PREDICTED: calnexin-like [Amphimedon queenslandica]
MQVDIFLVLLLAALAASVREDVPRATYVVPNKPPGDIYFWETFNDKDAAQKRWVQSKATKDGADSDIAKYDGVWSYERPTHTGAFEEEIGLVMKEAAKHYAIAAALDRPFVFEDSKESFVVQYEVNFQDTLTCGGGYVKLLSTSKELSQFHDKTPYSIMFGPDRCGQSSKLHFIVRFKNPKTGEIEEKHCKQTTTSFDHIFTDKITHLFTLVITSDDRFSIAIDQDVVLTGALATDFTPSFVPPVEIDDPTDKKPADWDDKEKIPDPEAVKPDDWDEDAPQKISDPNAVKPEGWLDDGPETIPDPDASQPEDWDEEEDGVWEAPTIANPACEEIGCGTWTPPMIANPAYKGKWQPPMISNPNYMGVWKPKRIPNPSHFELSGSIFSQFTPVEAVGFELWSMNKDIHFDNVIVARELVSVSAFSAESWVKKSERERVATGSDYLGPWMEYVIEIANERPYLWALYAVVLVLPFVVCAACCVRSKPKPTDEAARRKKTDAPSPDDPPPKEDESKEKSDDTFVASSEEEEKEKVDDAKEETEPDKVENVEPVTEKEETKQDDGYQLRKSPR